MGVDYDSKLIIGWELDTDELKKWISDNKICTCESKKVCTDIDCWNKKLGEHLCPGLSIVYAGNCYSDNEDSITFYLVINKGETDGAFTIDSINKLFKDSQNAISFGKKIAKKLSDSENGENCETEPHIFSVSYVW